MRSLGMDGTSRNASIRAAAPLGMLSVVDRSRFRRSLTSREIEALDMANTWYRETFHRGAPPPE